MPLAKTPPRRHVAAPLPPGTRVHRCGVPDERGTVQVYEPKWSKGIFPVLWDRTQIWESCTADDVVALAP